MKRKELFAGKRVPILGPNGQPVLYPRCYSVEETIKFAAYLPENLSKSCSLGLPVTFRPRKRKTIDDYSDKIKDPTRPPRPNVDIPSLKSKGNRDEAIRLRTTMGFSTENGTSSSKKSDKEGDQFKFGFSVSEADQSPLEDYSVFVGGMPYSWTPQNVLDFWSECGQVSDVDCMTFHDSGRFKGIAKVTYKTAEGFKAALSCDGDSWEGFTFSVSKWKSKGHTSQRPVRPLPSEETIGQKTKGFDVLFFCNFPLSMTQQEIAELFVEFDIEAVKVAVDETGASKGYAHIHFGKDDDRLEKAISKFDKIEIGGRTVRLGYANPPPNWKPKQKKSKSIIDNMKESDFWIPGDDYLVRVSGLHPSVRNPDLEDIFPEIALKNAIIIWSTKKKTGTGAAYLAVDTPDDLRKLLKSNGRFVDGRRLRMSPGKLSDYLTKHKRWKKVTAEQLTSDNHLVVEEDPLTSLL